MKAEPVNVEDEMMEEVRQLARSRFQAAGLIAVVILSATVLIVMALAAMHLQDTNALRWVVVCTALSYVTQVAAAFSEYTESSLMRWVGMTLWATAVATGLIALILILT